MQIEQIFLIGGRDCHMNFMVKWLMICGEHEACFPLDAYYVAAVNGFFAGP